MAIKIAFVNYRLLLGNESTKQYAEDNLGE